MTEYQLTREDRIEGIVRGWATLCARYDFTKPSHHDFSCAYMLYLIAAEMDSVTKMTVGTVVKALHANFRKMHDEQLAEHDPMSLMRAAMRGAPEPEIDEDRERAVAAIGVAAMAKLAVFDMREVASVERVDWSEVSEDFDENLGL